MKDLKEQSDSSKFKHVSKDIQALKKLMILALQGFEYNLVKLNFFRKIPVECQQRKEHKRPMSTLSLNSFRVGKDPDIKGETCQTHRETHDENIRRALRDYYKKK